jgi:hypothetical protein
VSIINRVWDYDKQEWVSFTPDPSTTAPAVTPTKKMYRVFIEVNVPATGYTEVEASSEDEAWEIVRRRFFDRGSASPYVPSDMDVDWDSASYPELTSVEEAEY